MYIAAICSSWSTCPSILLRSIWPSRWQKKIRQKPNKVFFVYLAHTQHAAFHKTNESCGSTTHTPHAPVNDEKTSHSAHRQVPKLTAPFTAPSIPPSHFRLGATICESTAYPPGASLLAAI